jgi:DNA-binding transcriptional LysR family regulator
MQRMNGASYGAAYVIGRGLRVSRICSCFERMAVPPDLIELRAFCVAADLGTVGRAAVRLHVSQPSLSKRLAGLEAKVGAQLLERSPRGVTLTPAGRRLYRHARPLLEAAEEVGEVMAGIRDTAAVVRLAASHSAAEAFVAGMLAKPEARRRIAVELVNANSQVVRALVADGRADLGVAASRPDHTPNPGVRENELIVDEVVCGVPPGHPWAARAKVSRQRFLATAMIVRDPSSNARWTVETALAKARLVPAEPLAEAPTPQAALSQARARRAPTLLSRHIIAQTDFTAVAVEGLAFPRSYVLVTPAYGEPSGPVAELIDALREYVRIWLR